MASTEEIEIDLPDIDLPEQDARAEVVRSPRVRVRLPVRAASKTEQFDGTTFNVSAAGIAVYFELGTTLGVGTRIRVACADVFDAIGRVAWQRPAFLDHRGNAVVAVGIDFDSTQDLSRLAQLVEGYKPAVLLVGQDDETVAAARRSLGASYDVHAAATGDDALDLLDRAEFALLLTELMLPGMTGQLLLQHVDEKFPSNKIVKLALANYTDQETVRDFVAEHKIFYFLQKPVVRNDLLTVVDSALAEHLARLEVLRRGHIKDPATHTRILEHSDRLAIQTDLISASQVATEAIRALLEVERAYCLIYERLKQVLWARDEKGKERRVPAASGLVGFVARTCTIVNLTQAGEARYIPASDDPAGVGTERYLAIPVMDPHGEVLAVFVAVRSQYGEVFSLEEVNILRRLASQAASSIHRAQIHAYIDGPFSTDKVNEEVVTLFRREALEEKYGSSRPGGVLRVSPRWTGWAFWVLQAFFVSAILFSIFGKVSDLAPGPAVVTVEGKTPLTAVATGTVSAVHVRQGQAVEAGQKLVDLDASGQEAELFRVEKEFRIQLARKLADPKNKEANEALAKLRTERDLVRARREDRIIRAPRAGVVSDIRVTSGQVVKPGEPLVSFVNEGAQYSIVAMIDAEHRPLLKPGLPLKLEFAGYKYAYQTLYIESISEVLGPQEARGYAATSLAEVMEIEKPVVVVRASIRGGTFTSRGNKLHIHPGMLGKVEITLRDRRIFTLFIPGYSE